MKRLIICVLCSALILALNRFDICAAAKNNNSALEPDQAVNLALAADWSLQAAKLELEIAQKEFETSKRILSVGGKYYVPKPGAGDWQTPQQSLSVTSGGIYDASDYHIYSKWSITYTPGVAADDYLLSVNPFHLGYEQGNKQKELNYIQKKLKYENTRIKVIADVRNAYAAAFQKEELAKLAVENLGLFEEQLKKTNSLFALGKIPRLDLFEAEQRVHEARVRQVSAGLLHEAGLAKLSSVLQKEDLKGFVLNGESLKWTTSEKIDLQTTINQYLENSLDIRAAELGVKIAKIQLLMESSYLLKNINLGIEQIVSKTGNDKTIYSIGFNGALDDSYFRDRQGAQKALEAAKLNLNVIIRKSQTDLTEAYRNWRIMELNLAPMQEALNIAKERLRITGVKYENGLASGSDVNQAAIFLIDAEKAYWDTWIGLQQARESFYQAVGGNLIYNEK